MPEARLARTGTTIERAPRAAYSLLGPGGQKHLIVVLGRSGFDARRLGWHSPLIGDVR